MNKRTQLLKVMMFNLLVWTQMQGMDAGSSFTEPEQYIKNFNERYFPRRTEEEKALEALADGIDNPYRFGPIAIDRITAQDLADIEGLKEGESLFHMESRIRTYVEKRTLMAKAGRQRWYDKFMDWDCNEPDRDEHLINCIFGAAIRREDVPLAKDLLKHGTNPNKDIQLRCGYRGQPIFEVMTVPMLDLLVSHGVDLDKPNRYYGPGYYPPPGYEVSLVHHVVAYRSPEILERLLQCPGVNVNARRNPEANFTGPTRNDLPASYRLPPSYRSDIKDTPLHVWAKLSPFKSKFLGIQKQLMSLIRAGADVTLKNSENYTALDILRSKLADPYEYEMQIVVQLVAQLAALMPPQPQADIARKAVVATEESACVICLENFQQSDDRTTLPCAHVFHTACVNPWIASNSTCPTCRTAI